MINPTPEESEERRTSSVAAPAALRPLCEVPAHQSSAANSCWYLSPNSRLLLSFFLVVSGNTEMRSKSSLFNSPPYYPKTSISLPGFLQNTQLERLHYLSAPASAVCSPLTCSLTRVQSRCWNLPSRCGSQGDSVSWALMCRGWWVIIINDEHLPVGAAPLRRGVAHFSA